MNTKLERRFHSQLKPQYASNILNWSGDADGARTIAIAHTCIVPYLARSAGQPDPEDRWFVQDSVNLAELLNMAPCACIDRQWQSDMHAAG